MAALLQACSAQDFGPNGKQAVFVHETFLTAAYQISDVFDLVRSAQDPGASYMPRYARSRSHGGLHHAGCATSLPGSRLALAVTYSVLLRYPFRKQTA